MDWNVKNAINRDVERQHLNKILKDIRQTIDAVQKDTGGSKEVRDQVGEMVSGNRESGISVSYDPVRKVLDFAVASFTLRLQGDVTGSATVNGLGTMVLNTTIDPEARGVEEAPVDNSAYWRQNGQWLVVPAGVQSLQEIDEAGLLVMDDDGGIYGVRIEGTEDEIDVVDGEGLEGNPTISLADLENTGTGTSPIKIYTRDAKGRILGDEDADTDDLPEGSDNLYFTEQRAQDAVGSILVDSAEIEFIYDDVGHEITASLSTDVADSLALANTAVQPGDNISTLTNDIGFLESVQAGSNVEVDTTDPLNPIVSLVGVSSLVDAADDAAAAGLGVAVGQLYRNGSVLMIRIS